MRYKLCCRCKKIIQSSTSYCAACLSIVESERIEFKKQNAQRYNEKRDPKYKKFYNSKKWELLKNKKMTDAENICERCGRLATEVHHIIPIQTDEGWIQRLTYKNLEALCVGCHNFRHNRFQRKKVKK